MTSVPIDYDAARAALTRLIPLAKSDTGRARRLANFLMARWNDPDLGHFCSASTSPSSFGALRSHGTGSRGRKGALLPPRLNRRDSWPLSASCPPLEALADVDRIEPKRRLATSSRHSASSMRAAAPTETRHSCRANKPVGFAPNDGRWSTVAHRSKADVDYACSKCQQCRTNRHEWSKVPVYITSRADGRAGVSAWNRLIAFSIGQRGSKTDSLARQ